VGRILQKGAKFLRLFVNTAHVSVEVKNMENKKGLSFLAIVSLLSIVIAVQPASAYHFEKSGTESFQVHFDKISDIKIATSDRCAMQLGQQGVQFVGENGIHLHEWTVDDVADAAQFHARVYFFVPNMQFEIKDGEWMWSRQVSKRACIGDEGYQDDYGPDVRKLVEEMKI